MLIPFNEISDTARLWVYQADKKLANETIATIDEKLTSFVENWAAHGAPLQASYKIYHDQFVVIAVDEAFNQASGCSIDASVHVMQELTDLLGINFFDRTKIAFLYNDTIYLESLSNLKSKVEEGVINENTLTFNNLIKDKKALETSWVVPAKETWMSRYFN